MPSPGAVWPFSVMLLLTATFDFKWIVPLTSKTMVRFGLLTASRKEPGPESSRVVT